MPTESAEGHFVHATSCEWAPRARELEDIKCHCRGIFSQFCTPPAPLAFGISYSHGEQYIFPISELVQNTSHLRPRSFCWRLWSADGVVPKVVPLRARFHQYPTHPPQQRKPPASGKPLVSLSCTMTDHHWASRPKYISSCIAVVPSSPSSPPTIGAGMVW